MAYKITYTVAQIPEDLPESAEVKKVSDLPLRISREARYNDLLIEDGRLPRSVDIRVGSNRISLTSEETVLVQNAISDALGFVPGVEADPKVIFDGDGETWYRTSPGLYTYSESMSAAMERVDNSTREERRNGALIERTVEEIQEAFGLRSN